MILVTGGAGFIGSNVVAALTDAHRAVALSDWPAEGDKARNLDRRDLAIVVEPAALPAFLVERGSEIAAVVHMAAISSTTEKNIALLMENNIALSQRLWRFCAARSVAFIYASSAATYGDGSQGFDDDGTPEALNRLRPLNAYGWSKHLFDRWAVQQQQQGKACPPRWAGLKFFNVYGPNEYHKEIRHLATGTILRSH